MSKHRIVILGTGFAAMQTLRQLDRELFDITVVSPRNYFLFTPLLPSTTVGTIEFRSIMEPVRTQPQVRYYRAAAESIDSEARTIRCRPVGVGEHTEPFDLEWDVLVVAVGATHNTFGIPGVKRHCLFLRDVGEARAIRGRIIDQLELASEPGLDEDQRRRLLTFLVVGGGPTGVEFAAELHDFLHDDLRRWYPGRVDEARIILLEASGSILSGFDERLAAFALRRLRYQHVDVRTSTPVTSVSAERVELAGGDGIDYGMAVWAAGTRQTSFVRNLDCPKGPGQALQVDAELRLNGNERIFALGDCAAILDQPLPATAQVAQQQGKYLGKNLNRLAADRSGRPFRFRPLGMLAYVGGRRALADLPGYKGRGLLTWLFWRSVYLTKLVGLRNKTLVVFDWIKTSVFGRDVSKF